MNDTQESSTRPLVVASEGGTHVYTSGPDERTSEAVVAAVTNVADEDPLSLPSLYEAIDPDALDDVFRHRTSTVTVSFLFAGYEITVRDGAVLVEG